MKKHPTRHALLASVLSLLLCVVMLTGTTFAWFTDSVTSAGNIIKTGTLKVTLEHADTPLGATDSGWANAGEGPIFNYSNWEPGYTAVKYVKIENKGSLDLKFMLNIVPNAEAEEINLADVIEVYMLTGAVTVDRTALTTDSPAYRGTLTDLMNDKDGAAYGKLYADDADAAGNVYEIYTIALKMSGEAGNEYRDMTVSGGFAVQLLATQLSSESDSLGDDYDKDATYFIFSDAVELPDDATGTTTLISNSVNHSVKVELPESMVNSPLFDGVDSVALSHTEPRVDGGAIVFDNIDIVDQNGDPIALDGNSVAMTVTLPAQDTFLPGEIVEIRHDGHVVGAGLVNDDKTVTYTVTHFCQVAVSEPDGSYVAVVGNYFYTSLQAAVDAAEEGATVTLLRDAVAEAVTINKTLTVNGNGVTIQRTEETKAVTMFTVAAGKTLTLKNVTLDGGAVWGGEVNPVLLRGTENTGVVATSTASLVATQGNAQLVLDEGTVLRNNDGASAVNLFTRGGGLLTINGAEILNNRAVAGAAIWGGCDIVMNDGKLNGNQATTTGSGVGGAVIRTIFRHCDFTMNGGEVNHNYAACAGGVIWGGTSGTNTAYADDNDYVFNGGEMAYNYSEVAGGALWTGKAENVVISGDFEMHHNDGAAEIGKAIRMGDGGGHSTLTIQGGKIYDNATEGSAIFANNNYVKLEGGELADTLAYGGSLYLTFSGTDVTGLVSFSAARGDYKILLGETLDGTLRFTVDEGNALFAQFMLDPADGYVYTKGDEDKLICLNEGYVTVWDDANHVFRLEAN